MGTRRHIFHSIAALLWLVGAFSCAMKKTPEQSIPTVDNNVCKRLYKEAVMYCVFVDSKVGGTWSTHDIYSTLDSARLAANWIEAQAAQRGVDLHIRVEAHQEKSIVPIRSDLPKGGIVMSVLSPGGAKSLDRWADKAGRQALSAFPPDTAKITRTKIVPKDRERLIARVRDIHRCDAVALMFFSNGYYNEDASAALHTASGTDIEYVAMSFKRPAVIAHEFLHLFGALDLYITPFDSKKADLRRKEIAMKEFPTEIMAFPYRSLDSLSISPFTEYLIGWKKELDPHYLNLITSKKISVIKY